MVVMVTPTPAAAVLGELETAVRLGDVFVVIPSGLGASIELVERGRPWSSESMGAGLPLGLTLGGFDVFLACGLGWT